MQKLRTITAWYTPQIPVSHGPAEYGGLTRTNFRIDQQKAR